MLDDKWRTEGGDETADFLLPHGDPDPGPADPSRGKRRRAPSGIPRLSGPGGPGGGQPLRPGAEHSGQLAGGGQGWWELDQSLAKLDYRLAVEQNHQVVYSLLNRFQEDLYNPSSPTYSWPESMPLSLQDQGVFIVGRRCGDAVLVAMMEPQTPEMFGQQRPQNEWCSSPSLSSAWQPSQLSASLVFCLPSTRSGGS